jgi:hypothetical protein
MAKGITAIRGRILRPEGAKWSITLPVKSPDMNQADYDQALDFEWNTGDVGNNIHAGNDAITHSAGCTLLGDCPSPEGNGQWRLPNPYQASLEFDLRFKAAVACAKRNDPNIRLVTDASKLPILQDAPVILRAKPVLRYNQR